MTAELIVADILRWDRIAGLSGCALVGVGTTAAELIKYGKNAFLATRSLCSELGFCAGNWSTIEAVRNHVTR